jgi:hypothetical protein
MALLCSLEWCVQAIAEESNQIDLLAGIALSVHSFLRTGRRFAVDEAREARGVLAIARGVVQIEAHSLVSLRAASMLCDISCNWSADCTNLLTEDWLRRVVAQVKELPTEGPGSLSLAESDFVGEYLMSKRAFVAVRTAAGTRD